MLAVILILIMAIALVSYELCLGSLSHARARAHDEETPRETADAPSTE